MGVTKLALIFIFLIGANSSGWASISFGHNLATTSETLEKGQFTAGNYALAYGLSEKWTFAVSPWMIFGYNLNNFIFRNSMEFDLDHELGQQVVYFETNPSFGKKYEMKSLSYTLTWKTVLNPRYNLYVSGNYMYFWNEVRPFSLRREPYNDRPYQFSLSTLHQFHVSDKFLTQFELGVLGLSYAYPFFHGGASVVYLSKDYSIQVGASVSRVGQPETWRRPEFENQVAVEGESVEAISVHPEIQLQAWF